MNIIKQMMTLERFNFVITMIETRWSASLFDLGHCAVIRDTQFDICGTCMYAWTIIVFQQ